MKHSNNQSKQQLQLQWEVDESKIWSSLAPDRQQQLVEQVVQFWLKFVTDQTGGAHDKAPTSPASSRQEQGT